MNRLTFRLVFLGLSGSALGLGCASPELEEGALILDSFDTQNGIQGKMVVDGELIHVSAVRDGDSVHARVVGEENGVYAGWTPGGAYAEPSPSMIAAIRDSIEAEGRSSEADGATAFRDPLASPERTRVLEAVSEAALALGESQGMEKELLALERIQSFNKGSMNFDGALGALRSDGLGEFAIDLDLPGNAIAPDKTFESIPTPFATRIHVVTAGSTICTTENEFGNFGNIAYARIRIAFGFSQGYCKARARALGAPVNGLWSSWVNIAQACEYTCVPGVGCGPYGDCGNWTPWVQSNTSQSAYSLGGRFYASGSGWTASWIYRP